MRNREINLTGARIAFGPNESACDELRIQNGQISSMRTVRPFRTSRAQYAHALDLNGYLLLPGLTNSHDHLEFGLFPNLGHGPYANFEQWARNIQQTETDVIERQLEGSRRTFAYGGEPSVICSAG